MIQNRHDIQITYASSCSLQETSGPMMKHEKAVMARSSSAQGFDVKEMLAPLEDFSNIRLPERNADTLSFTSRAHVSPNK